ncbi:hypothetical protein RND71_043658 [Anisodus tanguticus]|uniref:POLQ-like helical domain-containing protein n=1 Tax=Anisodus tanguticus TaxID=243964 RepID=A0AAE1QNB7_9SOLA|nr:hypothetical protein RND71_043658 [Anisodus tanguticus]
MNHSNDNLNNVVSEFNKPFIQKLTGQDSEKLLPTKLGLAVSYSSMSPKDAFKMFNELKLAMKGLVLSCDLHLIYQVVPNKDIENKNVNWKKFSNFYSIIERDEALKNVADIIQISGGFIIGALTGKRFNSVYQRTIKERHVKFYYALALNELIAEKPLAEVAEKYDLNKGELQQLQQRSSSYCGMMSIFCKKLGWDSLALVIKLFQDRLFFGITQDLIDLMNIPCLNGQMARCLFDSGFKDVKTIAHSNTMEIEKAFLNYGPFEIKENKSDYKKFWISVRCKSMNEKEISELIIKEARSVVEELAGVRINWDDNDSFLEIKKLEDSYPGQIIETENNLNKTKIQAKFFSDNLAQIDSQSQSISNKELKLNPTLNLDNEIPDTNEFYSKLKQTMLKDSTLISTISENSFTSTKIDETQKNLSLSSKQEKFSSFINHVDDNSIIFSLSQEDNNSEDKKTETSVVENSKIVFDSSDDSSKSSSITSKQRDLFENLSNNSSSQEKESSSNEDIFSNRKIITLSSNFSSSSDEDEKIVEKSQSLFFKTNSHVELFASLSEEDSQNSNLFFEDSFKLFNDSYNNMSSDETKFIPKVLKNRSVSFKSTCILTESVKEDQLLGQIYILDQLLR